MLDRLSLTRPFQLWLGLYLASTLFLLFLIVITTPYGIGTSPDSAIYLESAQNLLHGQGLAYHNEAGELVPLTHYPPLYPVALAAGSFGILEIQQSARLINALALAGLLSVAARFLHAYTNSIPWSAIGVLAIAASTPVVYSHWMAWSEPLFLFLTVLTLFLLIKAIDGRGYMKLFLAAVAASLAVLTRYAGIALIATGGTFILFFDQRTAREKILRLGAFAAVSASPLLLWLLYNAHRAGTATNRSLAWHPPTLQRLADGATSVGAWFIPGGIGSPWFGVALAALTLLLIVLARPLDNKLRVLLSLCGLFVLVYVAFLITSISFVDAYTPLDRRILAPLNVTWLLAVLLLAKAWTERLGSLGSFRWAPLGLLLFALALNLAASGFVVYRSATRGTGFSTRTWSESPIWPYLDALPAGAVLYSNAPEAIYLHTGRTAPYVPRKYEMTSLRPNTEYEEEMQSMARRVEEGAVVVYFPEVRRHYLPSAQELESLTGLRAAPVGDKALVFTQNSTGANP